MTNHTANDEQSRTWDWLATLPDHSWDWLAALSPLLLMMVYNYGLSAVWAVLGTAVGYLAIAASWRLIGIPGFHLAPALVCGTLVAACLPATAPAWVALIAGMVAGGMAGVPAWLNRWRHKTLFSCPVYLPALTGYLSVRWLFGGQLVGATLPSMWTPPDAVAGATPLAAMSEGGVAAERLRWMFWGFDVGSMGAGPLLAILLGGLFLLMRRRVGYVAPAVMLTVVAFAFLCHFAMPIYGVVAGGTVLAALLLGDGVLLPMGWKGQLASGLIGGGVTVFCRLRYGVDGAAVGVLIACVATTILLLVYRLLRPQLLLLVQKFAKSKN